MLDGPTMTPPSPGHCQRGEVPCDNGVCIPLDYLCDGDYDCTDRSDEANCGQSDQNVTSFSLSSSIVIRAVLCIAAFVYSAEYK